ncbi:MAG: hydroxymethylbilane synthase [Rickettsiales bacterium]|nr:hydroxymethylbilane synthase [Rickettsiales bacterium]
MSADLKIRIGTRASKLALAQVAEIEALLFSQIKNLQVEIIPITTSGDKIQDRNLADIGGKGLFIKELEEALLQNKIDIAVHSAKDVPPVIHQETELAAFTKRFDARDCFISKKFNSIFDLPQGATVGTSSARRKAILLRLRPDLKIVNFRGNVNTRLDKIENDEVDATILAVCGLERIGYEKIAVAKISCPLGYKNKNFIAKDVMLPAGGQGALAIQNRKNDQAINQILAKINHQETQICVKAERAFLRGLNASCSTPAAVHAIIKDKVLYLETMILANDGSEIFTTNLQGKADLESAKKLGELAAEETKKCAAELLKKITSGF